jgi:hypothetical protein
LEYAFRRDFERNGPSLCRIARTTMQGWMSYKNDPDPRIRQRFQWEVRSIKTVCSGLLWAMERQFRQTNEPIRELRKEIGEELGTANRLLAGVLGPVLLWTSRREHKQLRKGKTYEPRTFIEHRNWTRPRHWNGISTSA